MAMVTGTLLMMLAVFVVLAVAGIILQIFLSRMEKSWPGLILPGICFLGSLVPLFQLAPTGSLLELTQTIFILLLLGNIPTLVLLAIWLICLRGRKRRSQPEKMNIQELE